MTAEIAILNQHAVALAADSAVTIGSNTAPKIYPSANKLFTLSKYAPVFGRYEMILNHQPAHDMFRPDTPLVSPREERSLREDIRDIVRDFSRKPSRNFARKTESNEGARIQE